MFTTQLNGLFKRIQEDQMESIEDGARLLCPSVRCRRDYLYYGTNEMDAVSHEATRGLNHLATVRLCILMNHWST